MVVSDPEVVGGERAKILDFGLAKVTALYMGDFATESARRAARAERLRKAAYS